MYDELIKRLRSEAVYLPEKFSKNAELLDMLMKAADAIEELSAFREHITDGHFYCMRDGVLYEAKVEPPKGKVFQLPLKRGTGGRVMNEQTEPKTLKCCEECLKKYGACKNVPWCPLLGGKENGNVKA